LFPAVNRIAGFARPYLLSSVGCSLTTVFIFALATADNRPSTALLSAEDAVGLLNFHCAFSAEPSRPAPKVAARSPDGFFSVKDDTAALSISSTLRLRRSSSDLS